MPDSGSTGTATKPLDITQELALSDEDVFAAGPKAWWKRPTTLIVAAVIVAGGGVGLGLWLTSGSTPTGLTITDQTVSVTTGTITQEVGASGTIAPASQASLNFGVSGTVTAVDVKAGQTVTAGETLATLGTSALQSEVDAAQAQLTSAQDRLSSDESSSASTSQIDSDEASVTSAESSLSSAQTNLGDASLTSTIAGTVASVDLTVGQAVSGGGGGAAAASASGSGSTAQVTVIGTTSYLVTTTVDDTQVGEIADGDQVTITPSGSTSTTTIFGTVTSIGYIASQSSNVASFPVTINVTGDPSGLYDGATANVEIIYKQLNNVTEIPTAAITYDVSSGQAQVTEVVGGRHVTKNVTVGDAENGETQITAGLAPGDKVIQQVITFRPGGGTTGGGLLGGGGTPGGGRFNFPGGGGGGFPAGGTKNFVGGGG